MSDLVWGVGFTRSQNISQAKTTIKFDAVNLYPGPEVFLEIFLCERKKKTVFFATCCRRFAARFLFGEEQFQEKPVEPGSQSNNRISFRLIIQKEAAVTLKLKILRPRVALTSSTQMATEATNLLLSFVTWLTKTVLA